MIDMIVTLQVRPGMEAKAEDLLRQLEQETAENAPTEHDAGPSVPDRHAPEQSSRRQGS
jgi:hypothetical protein